ncbi:DUF6701 domain-containing protein [Massilia sp. NR 4-1]|uniref:DUF6701 domain-containing protein n=1 Tax=Massilia sp. NR 4-1 TaxID=1678028 RepID=UPI00067B35B1|nr:DUF6701 domain-containing protein [Massilia sp. NR 4-1]
MISRLLLLLPGRAALAPALLFSLAAPLAQADTYNLPADLVKAPFNCTLTSAPYYSCSGNIDLDKDAVLNLTAPVSLQISGSFSTDKNLLSVNNGHALTMTVGGNVSMKKDVDVAMTITVGGSVDIAKDARYLGDITAGGNITFDKDSIYYGNVTAGGYLNVGNNTYITGTCKAGATNYSGCGKKPPSSGLHHVLLSHNGSGLTCTPSSITIYACAAADAGGSCTAATTGVSGNVVALNAGGSTAATVPFSIAAGSSSTTVALSVATAGTVTLDVTAQSPSTSADATCWAGNSASCAHTFADTGFVFDVPDHVAQSEQTVSLRAVKKQAGTSTTCGAAFASVARNIVFTCSYGNPGSGTLPVSINNTALGSGTNPVCDASGKAVSLNFDATGTTSFKLLYPDSGRMTLNAAYATANISGSDSFVTAPARFVFSSTTASNALKAGVAFKTTVTAVNASGNTTPNFGKETPAETATLSLSKCLPNNATAQNGVFSGTLDAFSSGAASANNLQWSEVGKVDLVATNDDYLSSVLDISGNTAYPAAACGNSGNVGPFVPHHFDTAITTTPAFRYSGQPLATITVTARNAGGGTTQNYDSAAAYSKNVALSAVDSVTLNTASGTLNPQALASTAFTLGVATTATPVYTLPTPKTAPQTIRIRAADNDASSATTGATEATMLIRSGRLRLSNVFGSAKTDLKVPVRAEYWTGQNWSLNALDNFTAIAANTVALSPQGPSGSSISGTLTLANGQGYLNLLKPSSGSGYIDLAINLGASAQDQSCLNAHPASTGAAQVWLRSQYGACAATFDRDPSARATFGVTPPETKATVYIREMFN